MTLLCREERQLRTADNDGFFSEERIDPLAWKGLRKLGLVRTEVYPGLREGWPIRCYMLTAKGKRLRASLPMVVR